MSKKEPDTGQRILDELNALNEEMEREHKGFIERTDKQLANMERMADELGESVEGTDRRMEQLKRERDSELELHDNEAETIDPRRLYSKEAGEYFAMHRIAHLHGKEFNRYLKRVTHVLKKRWPDRRFDEKGKIDFSDYQDISDEIIRAANSL